MGSQSARLSTSRREEINITPLAPVIHSAPRRFFLVVPWEEAVRGGKGATCLFIHSTQYMLSISSG